MSWREIKRDTKRIVHRTMQIPVTYVLDGSQTPAKVRLHTKFDAIGDDRSMGWAEIQATRPRVVFLLEDGIKPSRGGIVFVQPGEAYYIENALPPDDIIMVAEVTKMTVAQLLQAGLPTGLGGYGLSYGESYG